ncbi:hypothetical protein CYMTET_36551, partial [Cymbomonas tetramitiformis]
AYEVGLQFRRRYVQTHGLLSEEFRPQEIHLVSTSSHRAMDTAQAFLLGLYPPKGRQSPQTVECRCRPYNAPTSTKCMATCLGYVLQKTRRGGAMPGGLPKFTVATTRPRDDVLLRGSQVQPASSSSPPSPTLSPLLPSCAAYRA